MNPFPQQVAPEGEVSECLPCHPLLLAIEATLGCLLSAAPLLFIGESAASLSRSLLLWHLLVSLHSCNSLTLLKPHCYSDLCTSMCPAREPALAAAFLKLKGVAVDGGWGIGRLQIKEWISLVVPRSIWLYDLNSVQTGLKIYISLTTTYIPILIIYFKNILLSELKTNSTWSFLSSTFYIIKVLVSTGNYRIIF